jgi:hypothetical protein
MLLMQDRKADRSMKPSATHGLTVQMDQDSLCDYVGITIGVPEIAADLQRQGGQQSNPLAAGLESP